MYELRWSSFPKIKHIEGNGNVTVQFVDKSSFLGFVRTFESFFRKRKLVKLAYRYTILILNTFLAITVGK